MKAKIVFLSLTLLLTFSAGCAKQAPAPSPSPTAKQTTPAATTTPKQTAPCEVSPDVVTTASIVNAEGPFLKAISTTGTWIIAITKDMTINKDLALDGEFKNGKKDSAGKDVIQRKLALYAQDANKKVTARYTLTAPRITVNSPYAEITYGTFKGDVYVSAKNFKLVGATVDGNVYFTSDDAKATFKMDEASKVTGKQEVKK